MRQRRSHAPALLPLCLACLASLLSLAVSSPAAASGFGLFQHGGRATAQAGAFTARASDPSAVTYNPAAVAHLDGLQLEGGLDFDNASDSYASATGSFTAHHFIEFPPAIYLTWHQPDTSLPFAWGIGIDSPDWYIVDWQLSTFPGRFLTARQEIKVFEVHPVAAYELDDHWSVGGGLRYDRGALQEGVNARGQVAGTGGPVPLEVERLADSVVDGWGFDLGVHYREQAWGWGAVYRSSLKLEGSGAAKYTPRDPPADPMVQQLIATRFARGRVSQELDLPWELRGGAWIAPYPELRVELDLAYAGWSVLDKTSVTYTPDAFGTGPTETRRRDWNDTLSVRLGVEGDLSDHWSVSGGVAYEPSPVPDATVEPGFPRGDAMVYATGFSYNLPQISFDVGYSFHQHQRRGAPGQEVLAPGVDGSYTSHDNVWAASARWRF